MPVRKIPKNHIHVTGRHPGVKSVGWADYESPLEAEHLLLLDHDDAVKSYEVQPVRIPVPKVTRGYVPDVLVHFHPDEDGVIAPSELREVKSSTDLAANQTKYQTKFDLADIYCKQRGWTFRVITELEIRTPRLDNIKFINAYVKHEYPPEQLKAVLQRVTELGQTDSNAVLSSLAPDPNDQLKWMPVLWHLVGTKQIGVDWDTRFGSVVQMQAMEALNE